MASKEIEKEVDDFAENSTLRGKTPLSGHRRVLSTADMDRKWDKLVREALKEENILIL